MYNPLRWRTINTMTINGHIGIAFRHGAIQQARRRFRRHRIHIWFLSEARDGHVIRRALGNRYATAPFEQPYEHRTKEAMNYVAYLRRRFTMIRVWNDHITFGEQYPRRMVAVELEDKQTGRDVDAASVHVAPLGKGFVDANPAARARHAKQIAQYVNFFASGNPENVQLAGGDYNERIGDAVPNRLSDESARGQFKTVGMTPAHTHVQNPGVVRLMEVFVNESRNVRVKSRRTAELNVEGIDHEVVFVKFRVRRIPRKRRK